MPFSYVSRLIAGAVKIFRKRRNVLRQGNTVRIAARFRCVHSGLQAGARRTAYRLAGETVFKQYAFIRQFHQIRRYLFVYGIPSLLIGKIKNNIFHTFYPFSLPLGAFSSINILLVG